MKRKRRGDGRGGHSVRNRDLIAARSAFAGLHHAPPGVRGGAELTVLSGPGQAGSRGQVDRAAADAPCTVRSLPLGINPDWRPP